MRKLNKTRQKRLKRDIKENKMLVQDYLRSGKTLEDLKSEFGIESRKTMDGLVNIDYSQIDSPKTHPIVMECRSLILEDGTWEIVSKSFERFFNYGEAQELYKDFDYATAVALEKIDGSLMHLFNYKGQWRMSTRRVIDGNCCVGLTSMTFGELFWKVFDSLDCLKKLNVNYNYVFELTSLENRVVAIYKERSLHLLTVRDKSNGNIELSREEVEAIANDLGCKIPRMYAFGDIGDILEMAKNLPLMDEGYVVTSYSNCGNHSRIKAKNPAFVAISHLKESAARSIRSLFTLAWLGEEGEFLSYFPEYEEKIFAIKRLCDDFKAEVQKQIDSLDFSLCRKDFAALATKTKTPQVMFYVYDKRGKNINDFVNDFIKRKGDKNAFASIMNIVGVNDKELIE